jgi:hypothetical protein
MSNPKNWEVEIRADGETILTIGSSHLSGTEDIDAYADIVRTCAQHLLSFIGAVKDPANVSESDTPF